MTVGTYTGDGTDARSIAGLGFQPSLVIVRAEGPRIMYGRTSTMPAGVAKRLNSASVLTADTLESLTSDGFVVGTTELNVSTEKYHYMAFQAAPGVMAVGSYTGDGQDNRSITGVGFQPDFIMMFPSGGIAATARTAATAADLTFEHGNIAPFADGIQAMLPDGFQVGRDSRVNTSGEVYHWAAFKVAVGSYLGDGLDNRDITGLGFSPDYVYSKASSGAQACHRPSSLAGDWTLVIASGSSMMPDGIQALNADGYQVGTETCVNAAGINIWWVAWDARPPGAMTTSGTYVGSTATDDRVISGLGFQPDFVIVKGDSTQMGVMRTSTMPADSSKFAYGGSALGSNRIQSFTSDGFVVGTDLATNETGVSFNWIAFRAGAGEMKVGTYTGNASDNRDITGLGFQPSYVIVLPSSATLPFNRPATVSGDASSGFGDSGFDLLPNYIQALQSDGFQVGTALNQNAVVYHYVAWKAVPGKVALGTYVGDGNARTVTGTGFLPEVVILKGETNRTNMKTPSSVGGFRMADAANSLNLVTALNSDGFSTGTGVQAAEAGMTFHWIAFKKSVDGSGGQPGPTVTFTAASQSTAESTGTLTLTAQLSATSGSAVTVPFSVSGTATNPADYTITASPLTIPAGSTSATITVSVVNDLLNEADETVIVTMGTPTNATQGATTVHSATLTDNDAAPTVVFTSAAGSAAESVASRTITAQLSAASGQTVSIPFATGGTATEPADYTITASPLTIAAGSTTATLTITVAQDALDELDETVVVTMGTPTNANPGATTVHTQTITDDDGMPTVSFTAATGTGAEGLSSRTLTAQLSVPSGQDVTIPFSVAGTATDPDDYTLTASPLTISAGNTTATLTMTVVPDVLDETDETIIVTLGTPTNATQGATTVHTQTITDDDAPPTVTFTVANGAGAEDVGTRTITAQLSVPSGQAVTIPFTIAGTASDPADYTVSASPLTIAAGGTTATIALAVAQDALDEPDETITITLGTPTNATQGATTVHTQTITDDDAPPTVSFATPTSSESESVALRTVTVQLSAVSGQPVTVPFTVAGTALDPLDYTVTASPLVISAGDASGTLTLTVESDTVDEPSEVIIVSLGTPINAGLGATRIHTLTITDDDDAPPYPAIVRDANTRAAAGIPYLYNALGAIRATGTRPLRFESCGGPADFRVDALTGSVQWTPTSTGAVALCVKAINAVGEDEYAFTVDVVSRTATAVTAVATASPTSGTESLVSMLDGSLSTADPSALPLLYRWDFGDGSPPSTDATNLHVYVRPGGYVSTLTVFDAYGASDTHTLNMEVWSRDGHRPPVARILASATRGTDSLAVSFSCDCQPGSAAIAVYRWDFGDGQPAFAPTASHTFAAGRHHVRLTVVDALGMTSSDKLEISVTRAGSEPPQCNASVDPASGEAPLAVTWVADAHPSPGSTLTGLTWQLPSGATSGASRVDEGYPTTGHFTAQLVVEDSSGLTCQDSVTTVVLGPSTLVPPRIEPQAPLLLSCLSNFEVLETAIGHPVLSWSLASDAPPGLAIEASTGLLRWTPGRLRPGQVQTTVIARNSAGEDRLPIQLAPDCEPSHLGVGCACGTAGGATGETTLILALAFGLLLQLRRRSRAGGKP